MALTLLQFLNGLSSIILVVIFTFVGIVIAFKYRKTKDRTYIFFGASWIGVVEAYYAVSISFIVSFFNGVGLTPEIYFLVGVTLYPLSTLIWLTAFTDIKFKSKQLIIQLIFVVIGAIFEVIFFYLFFTAPSLLGTLYSPVDSKFGIVILIYILFSLCVIFVTGMIFSILSIKSDNREHRLRGIFLSITLIIFVFGSIFDALELSIIVLTVVRILLIFSALTFYIAFILPNWAKKLFLKQK